MNNPYQQFFPDFDWTNRQPAAELMLEIINKEKPDRKYYWMEEVMSSLHEVGTTKTPENKEIIKKLVSFYGDIDLVHCYDGPHSKAPDAMLRFVSKQMLVKWDDENAEGNYED